MFVPQVSTTTAGSFAGRRRTCCGALQASRGRPPNLTSSCHTSSSSRRPTSISDKASSTTVSGYQSNQAPLERCRHHAGNFRLHIDRSRTPADEPRPTTPSSSTHRTCKQSVSSSNHHISVHLLIALKGNTAILPLRTRTRGPAQQLPRLPDAELAAAELDIEPSNESYDPVDDILSLFRANTFFRNFEIRGPADRLLIYGTLFVTEALGKIKPNMSRREAEKVCSE